MDGEELLREAYRFERDGQLDQAITLYDDVAERFPALAAFAAESAGRLRARTAAKVEDYRSPDHDSAWRLVALGLRLVGVGNLAAAVCFVWLCLALLLSGDGRSAAIVFMLLFAIAAGIASLIGGVLCCAAPGGAKAAAIGAIACAVLAAVLTASRDESSTLLVWISFALSIAAPVLFATFLQRVADNFRLPRDGAVAFVVALFVFAGILLAVWFARPEGKGGKEGGWPAVSLLVVVGGNALLCLWLLVLVRQVRSGILHALESAPAPQTPSANVSGPRADAATAGPIQRRTELSEGADECLGCGAKIPDSTDRCPVCGWSYDTSADEAEDGEEPLQSIAGAENEESDAPADGRTLSVEVPREEPEENAATNLALPDDGCRCRHCRLVDDDLQRRGYCIHCKQDA